MPTYEYRCGNCGNEIEVMQSMKDAPLTKCPKCGKDTLKKMVSGGAGLIFKGSGFYLTDYKKSSSSEASTSKKSETKTETKTESKPAASKDTASK
ncbi:MAG: zinc ribbon domain-containing protein [Ignavibacteria bacterium]|jgi:putative FmdB family regulatory protein|nr:zinc ribbon domain-containing protein [Ignavibacteria bacterium]